MFTPLIHEFRVTAKGGINIPSSAGELCQAERASLDHVLNRCTGPIVPGSQLALYILFHLASYNLGQQVCAQGDPPRHRAVK